MTSYVDREDYVIGYYGSEREATAARDREYPMRSLADLEPLLYGLCREERDEAVRVANVRPNVYPSKKRPGMWYVKYSK